MKQYNINNNEDNRKYFEYLQEIKMDGGINMYGASGYLVEEFKISSEHANEILEYWMENYIALSNQYGWGGY